MSQKDFTKFIEEVNKRRNIITDYLFADKNKLNFDHPHLQAAVYSYLKAGGKSLRPALLMFACSAVGGDEKTAVPAAAAVELYHTFKLVHDDIIDHDNLRRGVPTIHYDFQQRAINEMNYTTQNAAHYGLAIAILVGDIQQGWAASLMPDLYREHNVPPELALELIYALFRETQITLINGETLDLLHSEAKIDDLQEADVLQMLWKKTGVLYEYAGRAGAAIGLRVTTLNHPTVEALGRFAGKCGIAFQLQDDVLGLIGDTNQLGKSVGADIREGKRTIIVLHALKQMSPEEIAYATGVLGNPEATKTEISDLISLINQYGSIEYARSLAKRYVTEALAELAPLKDSESKILLELWARFVIDREK